MGYGVSSSDYNRRLARTISCQAQAQGLRTCQPACGASLRGCLPQKAIQAKVALLRVELVGLVLLDELLGARIIRIGIENLVEARIALRFVKELHQLRYGHAFALRIAHAA